MKKILVLLFLAVIATSYWLYCGESACEQWLSIEFWQGIVAENRQQASVTFMLVYIVVTALSLPFAAALTLLGGAVFGFGWGLLLISFASSIGATLAFLLSRTLLRDWVEARLGRHLKSINEGVSKDGASYLFSLRLVPLFQPTGDVGGYRRLCECRC
jgi:uncharacterized membrane protein YdjX (TVP38/TMEM64 family)